MPVEAPAPSSAPAFLPSFFRLAFANVVSNLMVPLASLVDIAFLGHLAEIHHLGGVASGCSACAPNFGILKRLKDCFYSIEIF
jgi:Na+-driven multidrug efflux pump